MRIAVIGAGAIGSVVGGLLARAGEDVTLIGRRPHVEAINADGLLVDGVLGTLQVRVSARERLDFKPDLALLSVKTQSVTAAAHEIQAHVAGVPVVTMQNGVHSDELVADVLGRNDLLSCVVLMGATFLEPGRVTYGQRGALMLGVPFGSIGERAKAIAGILDKAVPTTLSDNIAGAHWTKLIINEINALPAITGLSVQEITRRPELSRLAVLLMKEAAATIDAACIRLAPLPRLPVGVLKTMLRLPLPIGSSLPRLLSRSPATTPVLGSTLQSIKRGGTTEIDYLNGEIVALGKRTGRRAPYNQTVVGLVHQVEQTRAFLTGEQVMAAVKPCADLANERVCASLGAAERPDRGREQGEPGRADEHRFFEHG